MAKLTCSIIIVSYYTNEALFECLASLFAEQDEHLALDIIVVDNGNSSAVKAHLAELADDERIQWLQGQGNIGFAAGCNLGAEHSRYEHLLLLNPDSIVQKGALRQLLTTFNQQLGDAPLLLSGWLTNPDGSEQRGLRRNLLTPLSLFIEMLPVIKSLPVIKKFRLNLTGQATAPGLMPIGACSGACMLTLKSTYKQLHGMNEAYFLHVDDLDFCRRLHDADGQIFIDPQAVFSHYQGTSTASHKRVAKHKSDGFMLYFSQHHACFWRSPIGWGLQLAIRINYWTS